MNTYRVALIGLGRIAWRGFPDNPSAETHLRTIQAHPVLELSACVDIDPEVRTQFTELTGIETWNGEGIPSCDIAVVCTPPESHADYIDGLVDGDKIRAILCEKPLAHTVEDAERIVQRCKQKDVTLLVGHQRRYDEAHAAIKEIIASEIMGKVVLAHCYFTGGYLNNGTHAIDALRYVAPNASQYKIEQSDTHPFRLRVVCEHGAIEHESYRIRGRGYQRAMYNDLIHSMVNGIAPRCSGDDGVFAVRAALEAERASTA